MYPIKPLKKLQTSVKRLIHSNDELKIKMSRYTGIRKYTSSSVSCQTQSDNPDNSCEVITRVKFESLREHVSAVAKSLASTVCDIANIAEDLNAVSSVNTADSNSSDSLDSSGFRTVTARKKRQSENRAHSQPSRDALPIPVVRIGPNSTASYASAVQHGASYRQGGTSSNTNQRSSSSTSPAQDSVYIVGSSLVKSLGEEVNDRGINASAFQYAGCDTRQIRQRVPHIFPKNGTKPANVVLLCGGNDAAKRPSDTVIDDYENLIKEVKRECPNSNIILSSIPPRKTNQTILDKITDVNDYLKDRAKLSDKVYFVDVVPKEYSMFKKDKTHFNRKGLNELARAMRCALINFAGFQKQAIM